MKRETNISINSQIEIGDYNGYYSGDLLDANATANLIDTKIAAANAGNSVYATRTYVDDRLNDVLGIDAANVSELAAIVRDDNVLTGILQQLASKVNTAAIATVAMTGSYTDLDNKPAIPTRTSQLTNDSGFLTTHQDITGKANTADLATVATSGSYTDLTDKPSIPVIPTNVSAFTNDSGYAVAANLATVATSGSYSDLLNKPVAQVYYNFTSYDPTGETEYATGIVKLTGGVIHSKYEVEVLYQSSNEEWVGKKFYVSNTAAIGNTLYPLYDINDNEVGVSVKINSAVN